MKTKVKSKKQISTQNFARQLATLHAKVEALSSLMEVSIIINSTLDLDELIGLVMEKAQGVMKAEASSVMTINEEKNVLEFPVALGKVGEKIKKIELPIDKGIAGWVVTHGQPQIIKDVSLDPRFNPKVDEETGFQTRSILAAPLKVKDKIIGVAEVINRIDGQAFNEEDLELFSTFCRQVALAMENARIHQLELKQQRIEQQLEAAKFIQQSFLPEVHPASDEQQFQIAAKSLAAASVGGDFYDFIEFGNNTIGFTIGDVSGKGIPAALIMARMVSDFRIYAQHNTAPSQVVNTLNKTLFDRSRRGMFVTFLYGILNAANGVFTFSNAGHLPIIKIPGQGNKVELLNSRKGIPLGIADNFCFEQETIRLKKGDSLALITDGVIEALNKNGEAYTLKRVTKILSQSQDTAHQMVEHLLNDIKAFSQDTLQHDDLTIVVIKWR